MGQLLQQAGLQIPPLAVGDLMGLVNNITHYHSIRDTTSGVLDDVGLSKKTGPITSKKMKPVVEMRLATALSSINRCEVMPPDKFKPLTPLDAEIMKETVEGIISSKTPDERKAWINRALYCGRVLRAREEDARNDLCTGDISKSL
ncbi:MAG: hypothetical protein WAZ18_02225 [Alphaproteobacteria bacterium]